MTTRPRLAEGINWTAGVAAIGLFAVLAAVFATSSFGSPVGFPDASVTAGIGFAMFDLVDMTAHASEEFLVSFIVIAVTLDAALDVAVMLAKREDVDVGVLSDGGRAPNGGDR
jgi:NADH-quinone oxidoreductase subunit J